MKITDLYESDFLTNKDDIIDWIYNTFLGFDTNKLKIEPDGLVYDGNLALMYNVNVSELRVQFKSVSGYFYCNNTNIIKLEGCPKSVGDAFICSGTKITTLKFCPVSVCNAFYCSNIKITDPKEYRFALYCEIGGIFVSGNEEIDKIINSYKGSANRKYWPYAINLLSKIKL